MKGLICILALRLFIKVKRERINMNRKRHSEIFFCALWKMETIIEVIMNSIDTIALMNCINRKQHSIKSNLRFSFILSFYTKQSFPSWATKPRVDFSCLSLSFLYVSLQILWNWFNKEIMTFAIYSFHNFVDFSTFPVCFHRHRYMKILFSPFKNILEMIRRCVVTLFALVPCQNFIWDRFETKKIWAGNWKKNVAKSYYSSCCSRTSLC